jgi:hypothetical protein
MSSNEDDDDDSPGYRKPPKDTRFKKGQSGNPSGRRKSPRKAPDQDAIERALAKRVIATVDDRPRRVPTSEAVLMKLVERAFKGEPDAIQTVVRLQQDVEKRRKAQVAAEKDTFTLIIDKPQAIHRYLKMLEVVEIDEENPGDYFLQPWVIGAAVRHRGRPLTEEEAARLEKAILPKHRSKKKI